MRSAPGRPTPKCVHPDPGIPAHTGIRGLAVPRRSQLHQVSPVLSSQARVSLTLHIRAQPSMLNLANGFGVTGELQGFPNVPQRPFIVLMLGSLAPGSSSSTEQTTCYFPKFVICTKSSGKGSEIWRIQVKHFVIRFDRVPFLLPGCQSALEEFDPIEMKRQCATQNGVAGFVAWTGAVNNCVFFSWDERWLLKHVVWGNPLRLRNNFRIG